MPEELPIRSSAIVLSFEVIGRNKKVLVETGLLYINGVNDSFLQGRCWLLNNQAGGAYGDPVSIQLKNSRHVGYKEMLAHAAVFNGSFHENS